MSEKLKIKLSIANRVYPLTIEPDQEEGLRKAALKIDTMIKQFEQSYSVRDKQDVLAMCALQFASQTEQKVIDKNILNEEVEQKLFALDQLLKEHMSA
jgi:cell division protein ZapA